MLFKYSLIFALVSLVAGKKVCHGPRGDHGPTGPSGFPGEQGPMGDKGVTGPEGQIGQGNVIYCAGSAISDIFLEENTFVPFQSCNQTQGYLQLTSFGFTRMVQVLEDGVYQITFYAHGGYPYNVFLNGAAIPESIGGTWNGSPGQYTPGQFVSYLSAGTIISINALNENILVANEIEAVSASLLIQRIAEFSII